MGRQLFSWRDAAQADVLVRDYVCAQCWSELESQLVRDDEAPGGAWFAVSCAKAIDHEGFVRRAWVERQRQEDMANFMDAAANLGAALGLEEDDGLPEALRGVDPMKALGF